MRPYVIPFAKCVLTSVLALSAGAAMAQDEGGSGQVPAQAEGENPAPAGAVDAAASSAPSTYTPADFAQYSPRNALDLIERIPGFTISGDGGGGGNGRGNNGGGRGFGEASGNLLINGDRISSKSTSTRDELARIPVSNVVRIEVVDGATLEIPGLSGRVANVIVRRTGGLSGQFAWRPGYSTGPQGWNLTQGNVSVRGAAGPVNFTVAAESGGFGNGSEGILLITDADGVVDERDYFNLTRFYRPSLTGIFAIDVAPDVKANLNLAAGLNRFRARSSETRIDGTPLPGLAERFRSRNNEYSYEIGADIEFPLGPGRLKLIGLESFEDGDFVTTTFLDRELIATTGSEFGRGSKTGERIGRGEYSWGLWGADWQLSAEAAFNRLDQVGTLALYDPFADDFVQIPFPSGTGGVREKRYESILSYSRPITDTLSLQFAGGAELSSLSQTGSNANSRSFLRPKGTMSLAWAASETLDVSLEVARRVGQLNFGDFLASVNFTDDSQNAGNNELRPQQSWESELELTKSFAAWGSATLRLFDQRIEDLLIIVPLPSGGEARGNLASAHRYGARVNGTLKLANLGVPGAQFDFNTSLENSSLEDPVTGVIRRFDGNSPFDFRINFRHDIPSTTWAYGFELNDSVSAFNYRVQEFSRQIDRIPSSAVFVENKDVFGLTVRARMSNIFDAYQIYERSVFDGPRGPGAPILYTESRKSYGGQFYQLAISGSF